MDWCHSSSTLSCQEWWRCTCKQKTSGLSNTLKQRWNVSISCMRPPLTVTVWSQGRCGSHHWLGCNCFLQAQSQQAWASLQIYRSRTNLWRKNTFETVEVVVSGWIRRWGVTSACVLLYLAVFLWRKPCVQLGALDVVVSSLVALSLLLATSLPVRWRRVELLAVTLLLLLLLLFLLTWLGGPIWIYARAPRRQSPKRLDGIGSNRLCHQI